MTAADLALSVERAAKCHRDLVATLLNEYLLELGAGTDYPYLRLYWEEAGRLPYLFRVGDAVAGFGLVRGLGCGACEMAEFWVGPRHRRSGHGRVAALALFEAHPGRWSVSSYPGNVGAELFWRKVTARFHPEVDACHEGGASVFRFQSSAAGGVRHGVPLKD